VNLLFKELPEGWQQIEDGYRRVAMEPAVTSNPNDRTNAPLAVLV
jgi:hypothetical protein